MAQKNLVIVESPAKAKTISKYLGRKYTVKASLGHVRDLPKSQFAVDVDNSFHPKYITIRGKGSVVKELKDAAKKAERVYLATDPDREGEAISWHLAQVLDLDTASNCRVTFNEITKGAVREAFKHPRPIDQRLVDAQQARRILDRIVGYKLSPLLWKKVKKGLSAGRVQSVAVRLICDREEEIENFIPEEYWTIQAELVTAKRAKLEAEFYGRSGKKLILHNQAEAEAVLAAVKAAPFVVKEVRRSERRRNPAPPFTTSTLQQEASKRLGFTARKTMRTAQTLYEGVTLGKEGSVGLITYMRTDSTRLSPQAQAEANQVITAAFGKEYAHTRQYTSRRGSQDAHEAIRPSYPERTPDSLKEFLGRDELRLYRLIWERFIASQMATAVYDTISADIVAGEYLFRAKGSQLKFPGWLLVYKDSKEDKQEATGLLPELTEGQELRLSRLSPKQHFTEPPARYNEAMLVKALEELGIGRPSTYAAIIETIQSRGYVVREQKRFYPTELGRIVVELLKEYFARVIDVEFTAGMEADLDAVEDGEADWVKVLDQFYGPFQKDLEHAEKEMQAVSIAPMETDVICELCGRNMVIKTGRYGQFLACPGFPDCRNTKPLIKETGVGCPKCEGALVERRSRKGRVFYGCSKYPDCDFVVWNKPVPQGCPKCGGLMVEKRQGGKLRHVCINTECRHEEQVDQDEQ
ncbi:MAG: type I DNA topoisomerase [Bacillota bacterium]